MMMRRILVLMAGAGASTGVAFGLNQWSSWWQHSDMRQIWGTSIQYAAIAVTFGLAIQILFRWRTSRQPVSSIVRLRLVATFTLSSAIAWWATYQTAVAMTIANK